jgi:hypothetical protein
MRTRAFFPFFLLTLSASSGLTACGAATEVFGDSPNTDAAVDDGSLFTDGPSTTVDGGVPVADGGAPFVDGAISDAALGSNASCSTPMPCGTSNKTYEDCTEVDSSGACLSESYEVSDGTRFSCLGCGICATAAQEISAYCSTPADGGGEGGPTTTCSMARPCGTQGVTYEYCDVTAAGVCISAYYQASDGTTYDCGAGCACPAARLQMQTYCFSISPITTTCGTPAPCGEEGATYAQCATVQDGECETAFLQTSTGKTFECNTCDDCMQADISLDQYCNSMITMCGSVTCQAPDDLCCNCDNVLTCESSQQGALVCSNFGCN